MLVPRTFILFLTFLLLTLVAICQGTVAVIQETELTMQQIDSMCNSIDSNSSYQIRIKEGGYYKASGGWSQLSWETSDSRELRKIRLENTKNGFERTNYYYWEGQLIKGEYSFGDCQSIPYYYSNGNTLNDLKHCTGAPSASDLYKNGMQILAEYN